MRKVESNMVLAKRFSGVLSFSQINMDIFSQNIFLFRNALRHFPILCSQKKNEYMYG